jgi:hypothetical protein
MDAIREEIRQLHLKHSRGDIREKTFQKVLAQRTMALYRARVQRALARGEEILQEHHVIQANLRLTQSVLKEPEQSTVSLFLTNRRLFRVRSTLVPGRPVTCDQQDNTRIDHVPLERIDGYELRRRSRPGQVAVGLAMAAVGGLFYSWLALTGPVLLGLGLLGAMHGLLLPTRWLELQGSGSPDPMLVFALRKKSAKALMALLRERSSGLVPQPAGL